MVLGNAVVLGVGHANRRHYDTAANTLLAAYPRWFARLITRRAPLTSFADALGSPVRDVKTVITFTG